MEITCECGCLVKFSVGNQPELVEPCPDMQGIMDWPEYDIPTAISEHRHWAKILLECHNVKERPNPCPNNCYLVGNLVQRGIIEWNGDNWYIRYQGGGRTSMHYCYDCGAKVVPRK